MNEPDAQQQASFRIDVPDDLLGGTYANFLLVWHTGHEFTLDFAATQPAVPHAEGEDAEGPAVVPCQVVARVKVPPTVVFDILRAVSDNLARYEERYGPIKKLSQREEGLSG